eukprot:Unigene5205_Nuclearia_a/m.15965 Unigene5205_Nuclearia_a/g.15965  ORF Unigene5205_Nuclearia_a/g.15965 Unigene5205_Nuclearia_a/m.15965 type:complete len:185 (-) Unigene5205_Nuclearia_a:87-641(-)
MYMAAATVLVDDASPPRHAPAPAFVDLTGDEAEAAANARGDDDDDVVVTGETRPDDDDRALMDLLEPTRAQDRVDNEFQRFLMRANVEPVVGLLSPPPPQPPAPAPLKPISRQVEKANAEKGLTSKAPAALQCAVCLDSIEKMAATTCGHVFCDECIQSAVRAQHKCPVCRHKLSLKQIHPLFV